MINIVERVSIASHIDDYICLPFELRQKSRLRVKTQSGKEAACYLERGQILRGGDLLRAEDGGIFQVVAALEPVYDVTGPDGFALMRAAYHLGNRHVPLQLGDGWLRLEQDYVLKEMLHGLGMRVVEKQAPFEPEAGAYGGGHRHHHDDDSLHLASINPARRKRHV